MKIATQELIGIIGASGAGKSSLLRLLNYLHSHDQGEFLWENKSIEQTPPRQLRQKVVLVPQESKLLGMDIQSALVYPLQLQNLSKTEIQQRLSWCLDIFAIPQSWLSRHESEFSVGQRQLIAIARGAIMQPKILLLDEPTSALDFQKASWLRKTLINLSINQKISIVVVNHDLKWISKFAQRVILLSQGKVTEDLTTSQINWQTIEATFAENHDLDHDFDDF